MTQEPGRILVADDEEVIREACARILGRIGHDVATVTDGDQALRMLHEGNFDLLLLDIKMPKVNGMQVMEAIRAERLDVGVVVITGHGTAQTAADAKLAGAIFFLAKPFSPADLRNAVTQALDRRRLQ